MEGRTPLASVGANDHSAVVRLLLSRGADPDLAYGPWATAVRCAGQSGHKKIEDLLRNANNDNL